MNRKVNGFSLILVIAMILAFQLGAPRATLPVVKAQSPGPDTPLLVTTQTAPGAEATQAATDGAGSTPDAAAVTAEGTTPDLNASPVLNAAVPPSIDTTTAWNGTSFISAFGMPNSATYGQTLTITQTMTLTQFSVYIKTSTSAIFRGFVYKWDGTKASGSALFESAPTSTTQSANFEEVIFYIPCGIVLDAGQYVLFVSTSKDPSQPNTTGVFGGVPDATYPSGSFVWQNNNTNTGLWTSDAWGSGYGYDLAFKATLLLPASLDMSIYWNRTAFVSSFGLPDTATYGQTIQLTETGILHQFSFYMKAQPTTIFRGFVYKWDGAKATGAPLFESAPTNTQQGTQYQEVDFDIPDGIYLYPGQQYVLFASVSKDPSQPNDTARWGAIPSNKYAHGMFVFTNNGTDPTKWTSTSWSTISTYEAAFKAQYQRLFFLPRAVH